MQGWESGVASVAARGVFAVNLYSTWAYIFDVEQVGVAVQTVVSLRILISVALCRPLTPIQIVTKRIK